MIKLFRKIRYDLICKSNTGKYFKYAIGEIILVVIGILIALQINNWNNNQSKKMLEIEFLKDFQNELKFDLAHLEYNITQNSRATKSMDIILEHFEKDLPYHDSLNNHFNDATGIVFSKLNGSTFEALKSEGLNLISNRDLRDTLVIAYGKINKWVMDQSQIYHEYMLDASKNIFNTRFREYWSINSSPEGKYQMIPLQYEKLKSDQNYLYFLRTLRNLNFHYIEVCTLTEKRIAERLLEIIKTELKDST